GPNAGELHHLHAVERPARHAQSRLPCRFASSREAAISATRSATWGGRAPERKPLRIIVRAHDARVARDAQAALSAAGVTTQALVGQNRPAPDGEDITIVPADRDAVTCLTPAVQNAAQAPLAVLAGLAQGRPPALGLAAPDTFSGAISLDA